MDRWLSKSDWIKKQIEKKNKANALLPVVEYYLGKTMVGECEVTWILRCREPKEKSFTMHFLNKMKRDGKTVEKVEQAETPTAVVNKVKPIPAFKYNSRAMKFKEEVAKQRRALGLE
jgi:hypothetical protein